MPFQINPCQAINKKFGKNGTDINTMNNMCFGICQAYGNPEGCSEQCSAMLSTKKVSMGKSDCTLRISRPPIWNQIPRNFPSLLQKTGNVEQAYKQCCIIASKDKYPNTTKEMCKLDASAIIPQKVETFSNDYETNYVEPRCVVSLKNKQVQKTNGNLLIFFFGLLLFCLIVSM